MFIFLSDRIALYRFCCIENVRKRKNTQFSSLSIRLVFFVHVTKKNPKQKKNRQKSHFPINFRADRTHSVKNYAVFISLIVQIDCR